MVRAQAHRLAQPLERHRLVQVLVQEPLGAPDPAHRVGLGLARVAAEAGPVPRRLRVRGRGEEANVPAVGPPGRARGPAVDAGRGHGVDEASVGRGIAVEHGGPAPGFGGGGVEDHGRMVAPAAAPGHSILAVKPGRPARVADRRFWGKIGSDPSARGRQGTSPGFASLPTSPRHSPTRQTACMSTPERYDAIVIGAGQAGGPLAGALARSGRRTALIEREHVGGTCINEGCTPTKTMVASARVAYLARRAADYGVATGPIGVDMGRVRERKRAIVKSFRAGSQRRLESTDGLDLICAEARFTGPRQVAVDGRVLESDLVFINTGGRPAAPDVEGLDRVPSLDSTSIMELDQVPGAPDRAGRRIHRARVRPDVPAVREPGDGGAARPPAPAAGGRGRRGGRARRAARGRDRGAARGRGRAGGGSARGRSG